MKVTIKLEHGLCSKQPFNVLWFDDKLTAIMWFNLNKQRVLSKLGIESAEDLLENPKKLYGQRIRLLSLEDSGSESDYDLMLALEWFCTAGFTLHEKAVVSINGELLSYDYASEYDARWSKEKHDHRLFGYIQNKVSRLLESNTPVTEILVNGADFKHFTYISTCLPLNRYDMGAIVFGQSTYHINIWEQSIPSVKKAIRYQCAQVLSEKLEAFERIALAVKDFSKNFN